LKFFHCKWFDNFNIVVFEVEMQIYDIMPSVKSLIPYDYEKIRSAEYDKVIENILQKLRKLKRRTFVQVSGCPAAGKTTFCHKNFADNFLSFDNIMEQLPSYQADLKKYGSKEAFSRWEIVARVIGYEVLRRAVEQNLGVVLEHSGVNPAHLELLENIKKRGYNTKSYFVVCDLPLAQKRAAEREKITHRHTPNTMIEERFAQIDSYISKYKKIVDELDVFDTTSGKSLAIKI